MATYTIKDETGNFHGEFNSIKAAVRSSTSTMLTAR